MAFNRSGTGKYGERRSGGWQGLKPCGPFKCARSGPFDFAQGRLSTSLRTGYGVPGLLWLGWSACVGGAAVSVLGTCFTKQTGDMVYTFAENSWLSQLRLDA